ncbi:phage holin [Heyndrickxia sporothermodurans]
MDQGTMMRTIVLAIALVNQVLVSLGFYKIPGTPDEQTDILSAVFTFVIATITWFKNNYVTAKGKKQREILIKQQML